MANDENDKIKRKELHVQACKAADESKLGSLILTRKLKRTSRKRKLRFQGKNIF